MAANELEVVLAGWIGQALSQSGRLPEGTHAAEWIASHFAEWWRGRAEEALVDAELSSSAIHQELTRVGGWDSFGEAMHESCHLRDALNDLRTILGLDGNERESRPCSGS